MGMWALGQTDSGVRAPGQDTGKARPVRQQAPAPARRNIDSIHRKQVSDSLRRDSAKKAVIVADSLKADSARIAKAKAAAQPRVDTSTYARYETHPWLPLHRPALYMIIDYHRPASKDDLFYLMAGIVFVLAFIRVAFAKYFRNLFVLFFQTSLRQKQTRDQLLQDNLGSILGNLLFVISAGLYITLLIRYKGWTDMPFWWLAAGSAAILAAVYLIKYLFLLLTGWLFNARDAANSYVFVVFMVNKVIGVLLVPFLLLLSFASPGIVTVAVTVSIGVVILLFLYRYWVSFTAVRSKLNVNPLHFFLYLCAVELLPLALIYKVLIIYFNGSV